MIKDKVRAMVRIPNTVRFKVREKVRVRIRFRDRVN